MQGNTHRIIAVSAAAICFLICGAAHAFEAYIDDESGIVVSRGEAVRGTNEAYETAKKRAVDNARNNLLEMLQRQYLDLNSTTIGDFISQHTDKRPILDRFINTAKIFSESEEGRKVKVSLLLAYSGPDSYQEMLAQLQDKDTAVTPEMKDERTGELSDEVKDELTQRFASKAQAEMGQPYHIAVFDFSNKSSYQTLDVGKIFTDTLRANFKKDRRIIVVDTDEAMQILNENNVTLDELLESGATKVIKINGLDGIVVGTVTDYDAQVKKRSIGGTGYLDMTFTMQAQLKILDAKTGRWLFFDSIPASASDHTFTLKSADDADKFVLPDQPDSDRGLASKAFHELLSNVDLRIRSSFPLEGYVLKCIGDWVYINLTQVDGVKEGDVLAVYRVGDVLVDPVTNQQVDRIRDRIGTIKIMDVKDTYSQGKIEDIFASRPAAGDIVMLK